ncbi:hypothetical protein E5161_11590 [Cohnella pontilimi]|uniref:CsbD family protein n=1 Tax=Cohnella pontilimi TaxID=2564100 RepID=A0A4U0FB79_9BACL|nr:hypothetical protein [Cohnella pontilimi]TJY41838.1 hypothetical protein E5161_11590 [Cohnella pontilimi]
MNRHVPRGKWRQFKGESKKQWGRLLKDELAVFYGEKETLAGKAEENFGLIEDKIDRTYQQLRTAPGD